jgi:uncharacterized membrane protein YcaP (DUF421 family)
LTGSAPLWGTLAATTLLVTLHWVLAQAAARSATLSHILEGRPVELGQAGHIHPKGLTRHAISEADINESLRGVGLDTAEAAQLIMLEPSGKISVLKRH